MPQQAAVKAAAKRTTVISRSPGDRSLSAWASAVWVTGTVRD
jgi:hypothetical protein